MLAKNYICIFNKRIYKSSNDDGTCETIYGKSMINEGIKVFDVTNTGVATEIILTSSSLDNKKIVLYDCAYGECKQTYGYIQQNTKIYQCSISTTTVIEASISECNELTMSQVRYSPENKFQICVLEKIELVQVQNMDHEIPVSKYTFKDVDSDYYYTIKPYAVPDIGYFAGDYEYSNVGLVKTHLNIAAFTMRSKFFLYTHTY